MTLEILSSHDAVTARALSVVSTAVRGASRLTLGLPTGRTPLALYEALVAERLDWTHVRTFNLDEFAGLPPGAPGSFRAFMDARLFSRVNLPVDGIGFLRGDAADEAGECARYDAAMRAAGGLDLLLLGLGANGHIGFNEPGPSLVAPTHAVDLHEETRRANADPPRYQPAAPAPVAPPAPRVITNANIQNANISNSIIVNSTIHNSNLPNSSLHNSTISNSNLPNSRVTNANVHNSRLPNSSITRSNLYNSAAPNSSFQNTNGYNSSAPNSNFRESTFYNSNVSSPSYYRSASYQSVPAQPRPMQVTAAEPIHVVASPPPPPPPPPYNGMYDTAANRPARLTSSTLEGQVASSVRELEGRTSAQANLVASTRVPLLKGESNTTHASTLTLLAKGEPASKAPVSPTEKAIETDKTLLAQSQK